MPWQNYKLEFATDFQGCLQTAVILTKICKHQISLSYPYLPSPLQLPQFWPHFLNQEYGKCSASAPVAASSVPVRSLVCGLGELSQHVPLGLEPACVLDRRTQDFRLEAVGLLLAGCGLLTKSHLSLSPLTEPLLPPASGCGRDAV